MNRILKYYTLSAFLLAGTFLLGGCENYDEPSASSATGLVNVQFVVNGIEEGMTEPNSRSATGTDTVTRRVDLDGEHALVAVFTPQATVQTRVAASLKQGVKYRVVAYKGTEVSANNYANSAEFTVGEAHPEFLLETGKEYTFVCYSYNNSQSPAFDKATMALSVDKDKDFLYQKKTVSITSTTHLLGITFKHSFTLGKVTVDASATGQTINQCQIAVENTLDKAQVNLSDGSYTTGNNGSSSISVPLQFLSLNASVVSSGDALFILDKNKSTQLKIKQLQMSGGKNYAGKSINLGNSLVPGKRYNITLKIEKTSQTINKVIRVLCHQDSNGAGVGTINPANYYNAAGLKAMLENRDNFGNEPHSVVKCKGFEFTYTNFITVAPNATSSLDNYDVILITYRPWFGSAANQTQWIQAITAWLRGDSKRVLIVTLDDTGGYSSRPLLAQFGISTRYYCQGAISYAKRPIADINNETLRKYRIFGNNPFAERDRFVFNSALDFGGAKGTDGVYGYALSASNLTPVIYGSADRSHTFIGVDFSQRVVVLGEVETLGTTYGPAINYIGMPHNYAGTPQAASIKDGWYLMAGLWGWIVNTVSGEYEN